MKIKNCTFIAVFMAFALTATAMPIYAAPIIFDEEVAMVLNPIIERSNITIENGTVYNLTSDTAASTIFGMTNSTIVIKYQSTGNGDYQSLFSVSNGTTGNQDRHFHLYVTPSGTLGMELRNTDADFKYTMSVAGVVNPNRENIIAFKADRTSGNYKLFANGKLVGTLSKELFKGFANITGDDTISLGSTVRQGTIGYPFAGTISKFQIYNECLTDEALIVMTDNSPIIPTGGSSFSSVYYSYRGIRNGIKKYGSHI